MRTVKSATLAAPRPECVEITIDTDADTSPGSPLDALADLLIALVDAAEVEDEGGKS